MRSSPELVPVEPRLVSVSAAVRRLVELVKTDGSRESIDSDAANSCEEILVDTEVDGARYLLVRMPRFNRSRVQLSPREQEIVRMVAQGHQNKVIAVVLNISSWTVCTHLRRIFAKLGVTSRAAMVARLAEFGGVFEAKANPADRMPPRQPHAATPTPELAPPRRR